MNIQHDLTKYPLDYAALESGLAARRVNALIRDCILDKADVFRAIPERTFKRRLAKKENLKLAESDAVARLLRVTRLAEWAFQDRALAREFLTLPNPSLANRLPMDMAQTDVGAREVEAVLYRFVYGDPS